MTQLTEHFNLSEFGCRDGTPVPPEFIDNATELAENLEVLRKKLGCPIHILSAYRTLTHNQNVGGASQSQHLLCKAADIVSRNHLPDSVHATIEQLVIEGKIKDGGLGSYNSFTHYDVRDSHARW